MATIDSVVIAAGRAGRAASWPPGRGDWTDLMRATPDLPKSRLRRAWPTLDLISKLERAPGPARVAPVHGDQPELKGVGLPGASRPADHVSIVGRNPSDAINSTWKPSSRSS